MADSGPFEVTPTTDLEQALFAGVQDRCIKQAVVTLERRLWMAEAYAVPGTADQFVLCQSVS
jgi:hypothetical protein